MLTEAAGIPLAASVTGGNTHDITELESLIDAIPAVPGRRGRPRRRPGELYADRAYDSDPHREILRRKAITPYIGRRGDPHGSGLGFFRWVAERTVAWYHGMKRLRIRWERRDDMHEASLSLATCIHHIQTHQTIPIVLGPLRTVAGRFANEWRAGCSVRTGMPLRVKL